MSPFETDVATLHPASYGWALACCGRDADEASEVLQRVYEKIFSGKARFDGRSALRTWLFGVIRLTAHESRRFRFLRLLSFSPTARGASSPDPADVADEAPSPSARIAEQERNEAVSRAMAALAPRQREVLHLVFYEGLTLKEASEIMSISIGSASQHYDRGKARLLALLDEGGVA